MSVKCSVAVVLFTESTDSRELDKMYSLVCLYMIVIIVCTLLFLENHRSCKGINKEMSWIGQK